MAKKKTTVDAAARRKKARAKPQRRKPIKNPPPTPTPYRVERHRLTDKGREFAAQYVIDWCLVKAARRCGVPETNAQAYAGELIRKPEVQAEIRRIRRNRRRREHNHRERLIREISAVAYADMRHLGKWGTNDRHVVTEKGERRNVAYFEPYDSDVIPDDAARCISELAIDDKGRIKLKTYSKPQAWAELAKLLDLYGRAGGEDAKEGDHTVTLEDDTHQAGE